MIFQPLYFFACTVSSYFEKFPTLEISHPITPYHTLTIGGLSVLSTF